MPSISRATWREGSKPPLRTMPDSDGKVLARCASSAASRTSSRSPGQITVAPSTSRSRTCGMDIAATMRPRHSRSSRSASPCTSVPSQAAIRSATVGARSNGASGSAQTGTVRAAPNAPRSTASRRPSGTWLTTMPATWAWFCRAAETAADALAASSRGLPVARRGDQHQRGAEVGGDGRVHRELGLRGDVGEVGADDEDDVWPCAIVVVAVDDDAERRRGVGVQLVVGDAPRPLGGDVGRRLLQQQSGAARRGHRRARSAGRRRPVRAGGPAWRRDRRRPPTCPTGPRCRRGRSLSRAVPTAGCRDAATAHAPTQLRGGAAGNPGPPERSSDAARSR